MVLPMVLVDKNLWWKSTEQHFHPTSTSSKKKGSWDVNYVEDKQNGPPAIVSKLEKGKNVDPVKDKHILKNQHY